MGKKLDPYVECLYVKYKSKLAKIGIGNFKYYRNQNSATDFKSL